MNSKDKNYKKYLAVRRRKEEIRQAQKNLGYEKLEKPYQRGWNAYWVLRKDVARRDDAEYLQYILDTLGTQVHWRNKSFLRWDRQERRYIEINPHIRAIDERTWESLPPPCRKWFKVAPEKHGHFHPWYRSRKYVCVIPIFFLKKKIIPSMVTHRKIKDEVLEQEWAELDKLEDRLINYRHWSSFGKSGKPYKKFRNKEFRLKEKREIKKTMRTQNWDDIDLPIPKNCVLWDMY